MPPRRHRERRLQRPQRDLIHHILPPPGGIFTQLANRVRQLYNRRPQPSAADRALQEAFDAQVASVRETPQQHARRNTALNDPVMYHDYEGEFEHTDYIPHPLNRMEHNPRSTYLDRALQRFLPIPPGYLEPAQRRMMVPRSDFGDPEEHQAFQLLERARRRRMAHRDRRMHLEDATNRNLAAYHDLDEPDRDFGTWAINWPGPASLDPSSDFRFTYVPRPGPRGSVQFSGTGALGLNLFQLASNIRSNSTISNTHLPYMFPEIREAVAPIVGPPEGQATFLSPIAHNPFVPPSIGGGSTAPSIGSSSQGPPSISDTGEGTSNRAIVSRRRRGGGISRRRR